MGRPIGSGSGLGTKPSNSLIKARVALLTWGPIHCLASRIEEASTEETTERAAAIRIDKCISVDGYFLWKELE